MPETLSPSERMLVHVEALGYLFRRMDPDEARERVEARYREALAIYHEDLEAERGSHDS